MTKLSPHFCFNINADCDPNKAYWLGFMLFPIMKDIFQNENGLEMMKGISKAFPEIEILQE